MKSAGTTSHRYRQRQPKHAFTLIELLVVIAIIAILAAILFPVFARARESARRTSCLSNLKQIGLGFMQYTQDYDEAYPLSSFPANNVSWTLSTQPYMKSLQLYRCPSDTGARWNTPVAPPAANYYTTSYIMSAWIAGTARYARLSAMPSPASVIILADANTDQAQRDHFHPFYWTSDPDMAPSAFMTGITWDAAKGETRELALRRHLETFNAMYADGHVKASRWSQVWFQDPARGILEGAFDPRQ
jgi:prepilin-type N-terminal cleavage/methylation domain-containing protein/prepilin-type processing-associated H-X9-DG protein